MRAPHREKAAAVAVGVDVHRRMLAQFRRMGLGPFGRAQQAGLLTVPRGVDDRPPRLPPLAEQGAHRPRLLHERDLPRDRVLRAVHPGVVVIAAHDPLIRRFGPLDRGDHVVDRLGIPVELRPEVHPRRSGSDVVGERQRPAPLPWRHRAAERSQQRLRIGVGDRQHGDPGERGSVGERQARRAGSGPRAGRQRIARVGGHVGHAAALHPVPRPERPGRKHLAGVVAVVLRIGIYETPDRTMLRGDLRLDPAPGASVAGDHDRAAHRDPPPVEFIVVRRHPTVHVDQRRGDVAIHRIGVVGRQLLLPLTGGGIRRERRLLQPGDELHRGDQLDHPLLRGRKEHIEPFDPRIQPPRLEPGQDPFGILPVVRGTDVVRPRREAPHRLAEGVGIGDRAETGLPLPLGPRRIGGESGKRR